MYLALGAALALSLMLGTHVPSRARSVAAAGRQDTTLTTRVLGTWRGRRTTPISIVPDTITMTWRRDADGHLVGSVQLPGQPIYPVSVVWTSDTAFIYQSAPHMSHLLHYRVVTRGLVRFSNDTLEGKFDASTTQYGEPTISGRFWALRST